MKVTCDEAKEIMMNDEDVKMRISMNGSFDYCYYNGSMKKFRFCYVGVDCPDRRWSDNNLDAYKGKEWYVTHRHTATQ